MIFFPRNDSQTAHESQRWSHGLIQNLRLMFDLWLLEAVLDTKDELHYDDPTMLQGIKR